MANGYRGWVANSANTGFFFLRGDTTISLQANAEGAYYLNTGATVDVARPRQLSFIFLFFNKAGLIDSLQPKQSAAVDPDGHTIRLHTAAVTLDPGRFTRRWYPSFGVFGAAQPGFYVGKQTVRLIAGQTYCLDDSHSNLTGPDVDAKPVDYPSYFHFTVLGNGRVRLYGSNNASAQATSHGLKFKTVRVAIAPQEISDGVPLHVGPISSPLVVLKKTTFPFIRATANYVSWLDAAGGVRLFYFLPM